MTEQECPACQMAFDWPGVTYSGVDYCCEGCARGSDCTCADHDHGKQPPDTCESGYWPVGRAIDSPDDLPEKG